jgi:uncharacterized protein (DUF58 family)
MSEGRTIDPELLDGLGSLELRARRLVEGALSGMHPSRLAGDNVEFAGHREYTPGDDVRDMDWKAFARLDRYYLKESLDETNLIAWLAVDCSGSMGYPAGSPGKIGRSALLASALAWMLLEQGDSVGLYAFPGRGVVLPPKSSRAYFGEIASRLELLEAGGRTGLKEAAYELAGAARRRGLVVIFSDLLDPDPEVLPALAQIARRGHDLAVFHVLDSSEIEFPFSGLTLFCDTESEGQVPADPGEMAEAYRGEFSAFMEGVKRSLTDAGADYRLTRSDEPPEIVLRGFLEGRQGRRRRK